jgi:hypothetical protein
VRPTSRDARGVEWDVHIEWVGRRLDDGPLMRRWHERRRRVVERNRTTRRKDRDSRWWDWLDIPLVDDGLAIFLAVIAFIVAVALIVVVGPWLIALLLGAMELTLILLACAAALVTRTILRRPWRVVARSNDGRQFDWDVVGYRRSRELVRVIRDAIAAGITPSAIAVDRLAPRRAS